MPLRFFSALIISSIISIAANAQKFTISGYVTDEKTGEKLIGTNIYEPSLKTGTTTNLYGFFSITLAATDSLNFVIKYVGYQPKVFSIKLNRDIQLNIALSPSIELKAFEVVEERVSKIEELSQMSVIEIPISQIKSIPALLGEVDVMKSLQLLPGVQSGSEGSSGLYVRGGGPDQNLILLDGAPVYNANHLFGFFSVFNADAIKNVQLIKGGFPARYGGRLSSVIDINMKEGNMKKFSGEGSVGIVASRLTLEGPIIKDKASFIISARRTYIDLLTRPIIKMASQGNATGGYYFYDFNAKVNYKISETDHLYLSFYSGDDRFFTRFQEEYLYNETKSVDRFDMRLGWGNATSTLRWNKIISPKLFSNVSLMYSRFNFYTGFSNESEQTFNNVTTKEEFNLRYLTGIQDISGKIDFDFLPSPNHYVRFGVGNIYHQFNTGALQYKISNSFDPLDTTIGKNPLFAHEMSAYIEDDWKISNRLKANIGLHYSGFLVKNSYYKSLQPRISSRYMLNEQWALKASYASMMQFIHLLSNAGLGMPTDLWVPATDKVKPQESWQGATGIARTVRIKEQNYEFSVEGYYKYMKNIIEYSSGASFFEQANNWESQVEPGVGWSYGTEIFIQKKTGNLTGWIGYTLSKTDRQFENLNFGKVFPYRFDRRHDFSMVFSYKILENIDFAATFVYGTGNAITLPLARYQTVYNSWGYSWYNENFHYGERNSFRMRAYHRADVGINFRKATFYGERTINLGVYNVYSRRNPFFYYAGNDREGNRQILQVSLFPMIPSISYNFKF
jgi:hypothetical protein